MNNMSEKPPPPQPPPPPLLMQHSILPLPPPQTNDQYQYEPAYVTLGKTSNNNSIAMATAATPTVTSTTTMTMTMTTSPNGDEVSNLLKYQSGIGLGSGIVGVTSGLPDGNLLILGKSMNNANPSIVMGASVGGAGSGGGVSCVGVSGMGHMSSVGISGGNIGTSNTSCNKKSTGGGVGGSSSRKAKRNCCYCFGRPSAMKPMSFWTGLITNLGICTLLLAYTLLGSFIFLTIENEDYSLLHHQQRTLASTKRQSGSNSLPPQRRVDNSSIASSSSSGSSSGNGSGRTGSSGLLLNGINAPQSAIEVDTYDVRQQTIENIWDITVSLNILYKENWTKLAALEIAKFQDQLIKRLSEDVTLSNLDDSSPASEAVLLLPHGRDDENYEWNFAKAFLYSLTVLTTIGYGNIAPKTTLGRLVTLAYAILGIPLTLIYLSSTGGVLAKVAREVFSRALCCCLCSNCGYCCYDEKRMAEKERRMKRKRQQEEMRAQQSAMNEPFYVRPGSLHNNFHSPEKQQHLVGPHNNMLPDVDSLSASDSRGSMHGLSILAPILLCLCMMIIYIMFGAAVLYRLENWPILDGVYFCFMSLSTIGFGDLVPGLKKESTATTWFCSVYIMSGMALTAMCFNVLHEEIVHRIKVVVEFNKNSTLENEDGTTKQGFYMPP
ncbi:uncharacterized protein LOC129944637 [Eupeodes corollae]|uniref:uncharacterized protein LOC129944637 n=1 Tax=Eupeodes corollae TaxID=290404 RepID=UPI002491DFC9|nr:uncharacterized protein LOC129944637 [Eupeodes corollae]XP_055910178.1 uncharacterized protein LOC129944637 [Eupeodes corollae]